MVIFVLQIFSQLLHHVRPESFDSYFSLTRVNIKSAKVAIGTISQYPHFDSMLGWLLRHVLFEARTTLKLDHSLIYSTSLDGWFIESCKLVAEMSDQGSNLTKPIMRWVTTWSKLVVHKVQVLGDFPETPARNSVSNWSIPQSLISAPIIAERWQMVHTHQDGEAKESFQLVHSDGCPRLILLVAHHLLSIAIAFLYYFFLQVLRKEKLKHIDG